MREGRLPLRTVLQNYINRVDSIEACRADGGDDIYEKEFQELKAITESLKAQPGFECSEGEKEVNRRKNRYKDILPYDYTRVVLTPQQQNGEDSSSEATTTNNGEDYINANYIRGAGGSRAYIASQGPLPHTLDDFWRMVVQCEVQVIVMASNETEGGKHKCECYWVCSDGEERQFGEVQVSFVKCRQVCPDFLVRTLKITFTNTQGEKESRVVCQFHYSLWPDHGVPGSVKPLLSMVRLVRECQASETLPLLVHCSAGCGRTGTICAIDHVWTLMRTGRLPDHVDLLVIVKEMRHQRVAMVQTRDQYVLLHRAVRRLFHDRLALIDNHPYANVAVDGTPLGTGMGSHNNSYEQLYYDKTNTDSSLESPYNSLQHTKQPQHTSRHHSKVIPSPIPVLRPPSPVLPPHLHHNPHLHPNIPGQSGCSSAFRAPAPSSLTNTKLASPSSAQQFASPATHKQQHSSIIDRHLSSSSQHLNSGAPSAASTLSPSSYSHPSTPNQQASTPNLHLALVNQLTTPTTNNQSSSNPGTPNNAPFYLNFSSLQAKSSLVAADGESCLRSDSLDPKSSVDEIDNSSNNFPQQQMIAKYSSPSGTPYGTPMGTPGSTPAGTPITTPNPLQGIGLLLAPPNPPTPPTRSQTPSPVIAFNKKAYETYSAAQKQRFQQQQVLLQQQQQQQHHLHANNPQSPANQSHHKYASNSFPCESKPRKSTELTRRPSIQKLKEMFETIKSTNSINDNSSVVADESTKDPSSSSVSQSTVKLSRSASSVTLRNSNLSLHNDKEVNRTGRLRRKAGMGSEESLNMMHASSQAMNSSDSVSRTGHLAICPPPPPLYDQHLYDSSAITADRRVMDPSYFGKDHRNCVSSGDNPVNNRSSKPPSSPSHTSPNSSRRRVVQHLDAHSGMASRVPPLEERPALPIKIKKKSKSFRYNREQMPNSTMAGRSPELSRKGPIDLNTYFSLDRAKNEPNGSCVSPTVRTSNSCSTSGLIRGDASTSTHVGDMPSPRDGFKLSVFQSSGAMPSSQMNGSKSSLSYSRDDVRPQIPPKKSVQDRFKMSQSMTSADGLLSSNTVQLNSEHKFTEAVLGPRHHLVSTYESSPRNSPVWKSPQSSDSEQSLYDQLPCTLENKHPSLPARKIDPSHSIIDNQKNDLNNSKKSKDYVNARLVCTSDSVGEKCAYIPQPARRTTTDAICSDKSTHDYANFAVNENEQLSFTEDEPKFLISPDKCKTSGVDAIDSEGKFRLSNENATSDKSPVYEDVQGVTEQHPSICQAKNYVNSSFLQSVQDLQKASASLPTIPSTSKTDYEPIDFGENSEGASEEEVVEVVNREIVGDNYRRAELDGGNDSSLLDCSHTSESSDVATEILLHNSLDSIAKQVYQDCEDYLLYGSNKSPVPSLMPKQDTRSSNCKSSEFLSSSPQKYPRGANDELLAASSPQTCFPADAFAAAGKTSDTSADTTQDASLDVSMDMTEVKNKVNITPQGLRTRERRNSYRQAVNHIGSNWRADKSNPQQRTSDSSPGKMAAKIGPNIMESNEEGGQATPDSSVSEGQTTSDTRKSVHKYETIWFEKTRETLSREEQQRETSRSDENLRLTRSIVDDSLLNRKGFLAANKLHAANSGSKLSSEENPEDTQLTKNKREDLQGFVNSLERSRVPSKDSADVDSNVSNVNKSINNVSSTSSNSSVSSNCFNAAQSSASSSSKNKSGKEPIYVNTKELRAAAQHQPPQSLPARTFKKKSNDNPPPCSSNSVNRRYQEQHNALGSPNPSSGHHSLTPLMTKSSQGSLSNNSSRDSDTFPLISKPPGPCPTTPTKQSPRTPANPYMKISQPRGLGSPLTNSNDPSWQGCNASKQCPGNQFSAQASNVTHPNAQHDNNISQPQSLTSLDSRCSTTPTDNRKGTDYTNKSRSLPPPPTPAHQKPHQQPVNNKMHSHELQNNNITGRFPPDITEPIYNVPFDQKKDVVTKQVRSPYQHLRHDGRSSTSSTNQTVHAHRNGISHSHQNREQFSNIHRSGHDQNKGLYGCTTRGAPDNRDQYGNNAQRGSHVSRSQQSAKAHIVGDIAIVGDSAVKLRRVSRPPPGSSAATDAADGGAGTPVAPPRVKRNSSMTGRDSSSEDQPLGGGPAYTRQHALGSLETRSGTVSPPLHRRSTAFLDRDDDGGGSSPPPALPAKTALHHLLPPPVPPATPPAPLPVLHLTKHTATSTPHRTNDLSSSSSHAPHNNEQHKNFSAAQHSNNSKSDLQNSGSLLSSSDDFSLLSPLSHSSSASVQNSAHPYSQKRYSYHSGSTNNSPSNTISDHLSQPIYSSPGITGNSSCSSSNSSNHHNHHQALHHSSSSSSSSSPHTQSKLSSQNDGDSRESRQKSLSSSQPSNHYRHQHDHHHHHNQVYRHPPPPKPYSPMSSNNSHPLATNPPPPNSSRLTSSDSPQINKRASTDLSSYYRVASSRQNRTQTSSNTSNHKGSVSRPVGNTSSSSGNKHRHHLLQRSVTSSAILVNNICNRGGATTDSTDSPTNSNVSNSNASKFASSNGSCVAAGDAIPPLVNGGIENSNSDSGSLTSAEGEKIQANGSGTSGSNGNSGAGTSGSNGNSGGGTPNQSSKFSVPGLFKKLRGGVAPAKYNHAQPKQSFVYPDKEERQTSREEIYSSRDGRLSNKENNQDRKREENLSTNATSDLPKIRDAVENDSARPSDLNFGRETDGRTTDRSLEDFIESDIELQPDSKRVNGNSKTRSKQKQGSKTTVLDSSNKTIEKDSKSSSKKVSNVNNPGKSGKTTKDSNNRFHGLVSPTSPKPLVRALGKFKFLRVGGGGSSGGGGGGDDSNGDPASRNNNFKPLQKSASVGHNVFTSVVQDCGFPRSPKLRPPSTSPPPARQHYL